jgi:Raf kinase inhibitor-like YbhB/YbcL family protein
MTSENRLTLTSSAFTDGGPIPSRHTCDGANTSPPLAWTGAPPNATSLALIVDDPDAPDPAAPKRTWVHWVVYNLPPNDGEFAEGVAADTRPLGAVQGVNDSKRRGFDGPCPPIGRHRYFHKLYVLDVMLPDLGAATKADVERAMAGHVVAQAQLMGTYERGGR